MNPELVKKAKEKAYLKKEVSCLGLQHLLQKLTVSRLI